MKPLICFLAAVLAAASLAAGEAPAVKPAPAPAPAPAAPVAAPTAPAAPAPARVAPAAPAAAVPITPVAPAAMTTAPAAATTGPAAAVPPAAAPAAPAAAPAAPAAAPEAQPAAAPAQTPETAAAIRRAYETLLPALVVVRIQVREDPEALYEQRAPIETVFDRIAREHIKLRVSGVRVSPDGLVLIRDPNLPLWRYGDITAMDASGATFPMRINSVLENHAALLLEPPQPQTGKPCVTFEPENVKPGDKILIGEIGFVEDALALGVDDTFVTALPIKADTKLMQTAWWEGPARGDVSANAVPTVAPVILDNAGRPIGVALDNSLWTTEAGTDSWIGTKIMGDRRLTTADLQATRDKLLGVGQSSVKEIEIQFRRESRIGQLLHNTEGRLMGYGLLMDKDGTLFVPTELDRFTIREVETFSVMENGNRVKAAFVGMFRDFGAFLLRAKGVGGAPATLAEKAPFPRGRVYYSLSVRQRFGQRYDEVEYDRYLDVAEAYNEMRYPVPRKRIRPGDFVAAADGRMLGFCAPFRRSEQDEILARQGRERPNPSAELRIYLFSDVAAPLQDPVAYFDANARPMPLKDEARPVWGGVEFQPMSPALARALGAERATLGGARGLLVTNVYDASPAARSGIQVRDILLYLNLPGVPGQIDLSERPTQNEARPPPGSQRPWRETYNYLTELLTQIGPGRQIQLDVLRDKKEITVPLTLQNAPDNFDNADQFMDDSLGLTLRELTYEVRGLFRLSLQAPGVVVSEVEPGSKAAVAQIKPYEIITHVNGQPANTLRDFERLVRAGEASGKVEFLVGNFGVQRIVELAIGRGR